MSKIIEFNEYTYVLHEFPASIEVSDSDYKKLKNGNVDLETLIDNYNVEYSGDSEPIYDDSNFDSYELIE